LKNNIFLIFFVFFVSFVSAEEIKYSKFLDTQIELMNKMNGVDISEDILSSVMKKQELAYAKELNYIISHKQEYIDNTKLHTTKIYSLKKIISINTRAGNHYAVLRDEIAIKIYKVIRSQNIMIKTTLMAVDSKDIDIFSKKINDAVKVNQENMAQLYKKDYSSIFEIDQASKTLHQVKQNLKDFYALKEINLDIVNSLYAYKNKLYRLNKYTKFHLINTVIYVNSIGIVQKIDIKLEKYGLSTIKILLSLLLIILVYFLRKIVLEALKSYLLKIDSIKHYSKNILDKLYKPVDTLVLVINMNMIEYVYHDFSSIENISRLFNIIYGMFFTLMLYRVANEVARVKISEIDGDKKIKNDMINVGIKILNFVIIIVGVLIALYFGGVDLTAVLSGLGIGGLAFAFAAKDTISNFFGTLSILFSNVFAQGDWIVVGKNEGTVVEIGLRVTTLRTFDNAMISIPNGTFATSEVKNWSRRILGRRIKMSLGIKYDSKRQDIQNTVNDIREMLDKHPKIATTNTKYEYRKRKSALLVSKDDSEGVKKTLLVYLDEFADSSMNILVYCYSKSVMWNEWLVVKEDVMYKIMEIFEKNNIEFAFPSLSLYHESNKLEVLKENS